MADGSKIEVPVAPALGISMNVQVDGNRQLIFQTYVGRDESQSVLNSELDRISKAADRQVAKYMLLSLKKELRLHEKTLVDQLDDTARVQEAAQQAWVKSGRTGAFKPLAKDEAAINNIAISKQKHEAEIADIKARIAETEAKIADVGA